MQAIVTHLRAAALLAGLALLLLACNLGASENAPPTLAPLPTLIPQATLGYSAPRPVSVAVAEIGSAPQAPRVDVLGEILAQVESDRLMQHVRRLQDFQTRHIASRQDSRTQGIGAARQYIKDQFEAYRSASGGNLYTFDLRFDAYITPEERAPQVNVVAAISGTQVNAGTILVGAHYDSIGIERESGAVYAPGANDNASGVAAVLELARILSAEKYKATVMFALFSAEEIDRQGSRAFAAWIQQSSIDLVAMINLDTIGNVHDFNGSVNDRQLRVFSAPPNATSPSRKLARSINLFAYNYELGLELQVQDAIDRENRWGDHFSFSELDYPAVRFINAHEEKRNADPTDTIEFIEPDYLRRATQAALAALLSLADGPRPPANIALRQRNGDGQELVWQPVSGASSYLIALRPPGSLIYAQQIQFDQTKLPWDGFDGYESIAIAAIDERGIIGPLSREVFPRQAGG